MNGVRLKIFNTRKELYFILFETHTQKQNKVFSNTFKSKNDTINFVCFKQNEMFIYIKFDKKTKIKEILFFYSRLKKNEEKKNFLQVPTYISEFFYCFIFTLQCVCNECESVKEKKTLFCFSFKRYLKLNFSFIKHTHSYISMHARRQKLLALIFFTCFFTIFIFKLFCHFSFTKNSN
jgi:hypothetical protein